MEFLNYKRPQTLEAAYELYRNEKGSVLLSGGVFLKLQKRKIPLVIDLEDLSLDFINIQDQRIEIGPMTSLRTLEIHEGLPKIFNLATRQIAGVAMRNLATLGGSLMGKYPFSDVITCLLSMETTLVFYKNGNLSLEDFITKGMDEKDILIKVLIKKPDKCDYRAYKKVYTDFSLVNVGASSYKDKVYVVVGARPGLARKIEVQENMSINAILDNYDFKDDLRASKDRRIKLAKVLLEEVLEWK